MEKPQQSQTLLDYLVARLTHVLVRPLYAAKYATQENSKKSTKVYEIHWVVDDEVIAKLIFMLGEPEAQLLHDTAA